MRLLFVPQYPSKLRYQEWYYSTFPRRLKKYFDEVVVLEGFTNDFAKANSEDFSPLEKSIFWECKQIEEFTEMRLYNDDIMLINDLSFPGLFPNILYHKRPSKVFMLCHGTSQNHLDYYMFVRKCKWPIEKAHAAMCDKVFLATNYHKEKLGFDNAVVTPFPYPPFVGFNNFDKRIDVISVARPTRQKIDLELEDLLQKALKLKIDRPHNYIINSWQEYFSFIAEARVMFITSKEETFGYQVVDAILNNCVPIAPNKFSYPELLPRKYLYNDEIEAVKLVEKVLKSPSEYPVPDLLCDRSMVDFYERIALEMIE